MTYFIFHRNGEIDLTRYKSLLSLLLIIFLIGMQIPEKNNTIMPQNIPIQIFYSGNIKGYLEPCGCGGIRKGGLAKWSTFIKKKRQDVPLNLIIDSGDFTSRQYHIQKIKNEYVAKVMSEIKYDAINLSGRDLQQIDKDNLMNLGEKYQLPLVSSNIFSFKSMTLLTQPYLIKSFTYANKEIKIGIFALSPQINLEKQELMIKEPIKVAKEVVKELNNKCELIILLTQQTKKESMVLAKEVGKIDVIISSGKFRAAKEDRLTQIDNTLILQPGSQGEDGTAIKIYLNDEGRIVAFEERCEELDNSVSLDKEIVKIIDEYKKEIKKDNELISPFIRSSYTGVKKCGTCHQKQYKKWEKTKHAKAFFSLQKVKEEKNPECLKCHTTKFQQDNGFLSDETSPDLANVGCEECHSLGIGHVRMAESPSTSKEMIKINSKPGKVDSETICTKCHTYDKDPNFNFKKDKKKITH